MISGLLFVSFMIWGRHLFKIYIVIFGGMLGLSLGVLIEYYSIQLTVFPIESYSIINTTIKIAGCILGASFAIFLKKILLSINASFYSGLFGLILAMCLHITHAYSIFFAVFFIIAFFLAMRYYDQTVIIVMLVTGLIASVLLLHIGPVVLFNDFISPLILSGRIYQ